MLKLIYDTTSYVVSSFGNIFSTRTEFGTSSTFSLVGTVEENKSGPVLLALVYNESVWIVTPRCVEAYCLSDLKIRNFVLRVDQGDSVGTCCTSHDFELTGYTSTSSSPLVTSVKEDLQLFCTGQRGYVSHLNLRTKEFLKIPLDKTSCNYTASLYDHRTKVLFLGTAEGHIYKIDFENRAGDCILNYNDSISTLCWVKRSMWTGLADGTVNVAGFDNTADTVLQTGGGSVQSISFCPTFGVVFVLSGCDTVTVWDAFNLVVVSRFDSTLIGCGASLTCLKCTENSLGTSDSFSLILLAGIDGSVTIRQITRRAQDGKLQCVLLRNFENVFADLTGERIPCTYISSITDTVVVGSAGVLVSLVSPLSQLVSPVTLGTSLSSSIARVESGLK